MKPLRHSGQNRDITLCLLYYIVFGMLGAGIVPGIVKSFETTYNLSHTVMGTILGIGAVLAATGAVLSGILSDRFGSTRMLVVSMGIITLGALGLWLLQSTAGAIGALLVFAIGNAATGPINGLIVKLYGRTHSQGINLLHGLQGVGRLLSPLAVALCLQISTRWQTVFLLSAVAHITYGFLFFSIREPSGSQKGALRLKQLFSTLRNPYLLLGLIPFTFLSGCEKTLLTWTANYLETEGGFLRQQALLGLTFMMVGYTAVRLLVGVTKISVGPGFILGCLCLNIGGVCSIILFRKIAIIYIFCMILGFSFGTFWPSTASLLFDRLHGGHGLLVGLFSLGGTIGSTISLTMTGVLADSFSLGVTLAVAPLCTVFFMMLYVYFSYRPKVNLYKEPEQ